MRKYKSTLAEKRLKIEKNRENDIGVVLFVIIREMRLIRTDAGAVILHMELSAEYSLIQIRLEVKSYFNHESIFFFI